MKETTERRYEYFTVYVSDDGCCKNEDKKVVEAYEATIKEYNPVKFFETKEIDNPEYNNHWKVYKCTNLQEFAAALSDACRSYHVSKRDINDAYSIYNENEKFYAFLIEEAMGDNSWDELSACTVYSLLDDYDDEIHDLEGHTQKLTEEKEKLVAAINKMLVL